MTDNEPPIPARALLDQLYSYVMLLHSGTHPDAPEMRARLDMFLPALHWYAHGYGTRFKPQEHAIDLPAVVFDKSTTFLTVDKIHHAIWGCVQALHNGKPAIDAKAAAFDAICAVLERNLARDLAEIPKIFREPHTVARRYYKRRYYNSNRAPGK